MKLFQTSDTKVIVLKDGLLSDGQVTEALRVSEQTLWWRAVVQLIDKYRQTSIDNSYAGCTQNNPMATGASIGAHGVLTELLDDLEGRRSSKAD